MSLTQYQTGLSILFVGYILGQIPSNLLLNWFGRPSLFLGFFTIAWGVVSALTSLVQNFAGIVVCRFILGFVGKVSLFRTQLNNLLTMEQRPRSSLECSFIYRFVIINRNEHRFLS